MAAGAPVPHAHELVSALIRSKSSGRNAGGRRQELQLDITREQPVDDNSFWGELVGLIVTEGETHQLRYRLAEGD